jgi:hypothetical protein
MNEKIPTVGKFQIILNKKLRNEFKLLFKYNSLIDIINDPNFIGGSHLIYGSTRAGKTLFTTLLIRCLVDLYPGKFGIVVFSKSSNIFLKFKFLDQYFKKNNFDIEKIIHFDNIDDLKKFYYKVSKESSANLKKKLKRKDNQKLSTNETKKLIVCYDDCVDEFAETKNRKFLDHFFSQKRQAEITAIYCAQMIKNFISSIKSNTETVTLIGDLTARDCGILQPGYASLSNIFDNAAQLVKFIKHKRDFFSTTRTVFTFKNSKKYIYFYEVSQNIGVKSGLYEKVINNS